MFLIYRLSWSVRRTGERLYRDLVDRGRLLGTIERSWTEFLQRLDPAHADQRRQLGQVPALNRHAQLFETEQAELQVARVAEPIASALLASC